MAPIRRRSVEAAREVTRLTTAVDILGGMATFGEANVSNRG
jgi:hypothetical protein